MLAIHKSFIVLCNLILTYYVSLTLCDQHQHSHFRHSKITTELTKTLKNESDYLENLGLTKCCLQNEIAVKNNNGTVSCEQISTHHREHYREHTNSTGISQCSYRILTNDKYTWFRHSENKVEVGIIYLLYPVWMETTNDYCIDSFYEKTFTENGSEYSTQENAWNGSMKIVKHHSSFLAFCDLEEKTDYFSKTGLTLFLLLLSACFNVGTISIYIIARKVHGSREWTQLAIFVAECLGNLSYSVLIISQAYFLLWSDSLLFITYCYFVVFYMYTAKFALVIATSVDLLLCVWRPFSTNDELTRSKRNKKAVALCYMFPILIPGITALYDLIVTVPDEKQGYKMDSNKRLLDGAPSHYQQATKIVFIIELAANIIFAIFTTILIKRQRRKTNTIDEKRAEKNIQKSFGLYMRLIFAQEMPFSINFVLLLWVGSASPLSIWWNLTRGTYLISAIYSFIYFGCNKKHLEHMKRMYTAAISSNSAYY